MQQSTTNDLAPAEPELAPVIDLPTIQFQVDSEPRRGDLADERGEGVISAAIAVLIIAFLGVAMWVGFNGIWDNIEDQTNEQINLIGADGAEG